MAYHLPEGNTGDTLTQKDGVVLMPALAKGGGCGSQSPPLLYRKSLVAGRTLTYRNASTMLVTIPVTIITIPRTQKRPVHEVKST